MYIISPVKIVFMKKSRLPSFKDAIFEIMKHVFFVTLKRYFPKDPQTVVLYSHNELKIAMNKGVKD